MKPLAWISGTIALLLMLCALMVFIRNSSFLGVNHAVNYVHLANSFWLFTIALLLLGKKETET